MVKMVGTNSEYGNHTEAILVPEAIRGYRAWHLRGDASLTGVVRRWPWGPGLNEARCYAHNGLLYPPLLPHVSPNAYCVCGFYARLNDDNHGYDNDGNLCGSIKATGQIIIGTRGFRAQFAEIEAFYFSYRMRQFYSMHRLDRDMQWGERARRVSEQYGVPVFASWEDFIAEFPPSDVSNLLPEPAPREPEKEPFNPYNRGTLSWTTVEPWTMTPHPHNTRTRKLKP